MDSDRGPSPTNRIPLITNVYKTLKGYKHFRKLEKLIKSKSKSQQNEISECVDENTPIHNLTPSSIANSAVSNLANCSNCTTSTNSISSKDLHDYRQSDMSKGCLDDDILEQLVRVEHERAHLTNVHDTYEIGNSTPSTEICKCNICSFYNGSTPPAMTGIDPEMYPKCIYKSVGAHGIHGIKRKIIGAKKSLYKYITNL
ncbi:hypothetical protein BMR1_03g01495 [Babesia microti strain RI]|uniref:Uncharacterized protein n=1 Tax=Babesia microti (strain RI) TaxID=1133968 RepID=A0A0K3AQJ0_BABMR|nr:hypothetical protein BMR1_03g01495 [Babesia microti strain RI]CTQ40898.1 hypothetical protein BMR1_03g01495 [Babesia microti strain RI]|eukprot:XP_012648909.1 hypothetical protein BMR1_03g01495 [Babesia microti strain RI]